MNQTSITAAMQVLDDFMAAFNARDIDAWQNTFNFPSVRLASNTMVIIDADYHKPEMFGRGALAEWDHSAWERRAVIHAGEDKVHIDTRFSRFRKDGSVIWISENCRAIRDSRGRLLYYEGTVEEITDRVRDREALKRSQQQLRQIMELVPGVPIYAADQNINNWFTPAAFSAPAENCCLASWSWSDFMRKTIG